MAKNIPFVQRILAEGNAGDRKLEKEELNSEALKLVRKLPREQASRREFLINLTSKAMRKEVPVEVFIKFCKMTKCADEVASIFLRLRSISRKK